jgi:hypothetical protein
MLFVIQRIVEPMKMAFILKQDWNSHRKRIKIVMLKVRGSTRMWPCFK